MSQEERSGWRDMRLSRLHRKWGFDCPAADIDWLVAEYDHCKAKSIVEYKHELAKLCLPDNPNRLTIIDLANRADLPSFGVRYSDNLQWYKCTPLNLIAKRIRASSSLLSESEYVSLLYEIRGRTVPNEVEKIIFPPEAAPPESFC